MKFFLAFYLAITSAASAQDFDGSPWNVSTGNLSVQFIQHSPIGAFPQKDFFETPPSHDSLVKMKKLGLVAYEDYIAWGAVERERGKFDWTQHDRIYDAVHKAGLKYVVYTWVHFPPTWLRDDPKTTLMQCLEHNQRTNYLSIFDPKTIEHYDHFYRALKNHFGDKVDGAYACILGPYGEGNYPLNVPDWVNIGHCHEGYWCGDSFAQKAFGKPMPKFGDFKSAQEKRAWLDFITWYHQAIIDFAERSIQTTLKYFPKEKVRTKPGGNAGGVNPIAWGTYCPGYAKMAGKYGIVLQPADCQGAYFGDKWVGTAYQFYGVTLSTEPAGNLDHNGFVRRMFSDASCGAKQLFTYEFEKHAADIQKYAHLVTGKPGETEIAVLCPTTLYRLGGDLKPTIEGAHKLRDVCDFDVLDELLVADGALKDDRYKVLVVFQGDCIDQPILEKLERFHGKILVAGKEPIRNVEGVEWSGANVELVGGGMIGKLSKIAENLKGFEGNLDGLWTTFRDGGKFVLNTTDKPVNDIPPHEIVSERNAEFIGVAPDGKSFVRVPSGKKFTPWGFNYDRDNESHLIESYWNEKWPTIVEDFREMKDLGANVVRIHLQFAKFMDAADKPNEAALDRLEKLVMLAEERGMWLDVTGLGCYRKQDVPAWYDAMDEKSRWSAQANFWEAISAKCANHSSIFCYDLMNEPVVPGEKRKPGAWLHEKELGGFYFVQFITLDPAGREPSDITRAWIRQLTAAIRKHDKRHMITVGLLPFPGGPFDPKKMSGELDFISMHIYPTAGKVGEAIKTVEGFQTSKPLVIEEMFPMSCGGEDLEKFIEATRPLAAGWIGFYWGKPPDELRKSDNIVDKFMLVWLDVFEKMRPKE